jgi:hypothetical protein
MFDILDKMPNLEILIMRADVQQRFNESSIPLNDVQKREKPAFSKLRSIKLKCSTKITQNVLRYFLKCDFLDNIEIRIHSFDSLADPIFTVFMLKQKTLKHLDLDSTTYEYFFHRSVHISRFQNVEFQLETLIFRHFHMTKSERIAEFLKTQNSLKELMIDSTVVDPQYFSWAFENLRNLKTFSVDMEALESVPTVLDNYRNLKMETLETLDILGRHTYNQIMFLDLLRIFSNIKKLKFNKLSTYHFGQPKAAEKIEIMKFNILSLSSLLFVKFPRLKVLEIGCMYNVTEEAVKSFFSLNPAIEEFIIKEIHYISTVKAGKIIVKIILSNLHLLKCLKYFAMNCDVYNSVNPLGNSEDNDPEETNICKIVMDRKWNQKLLKINRIFVVHFQDELTLLENLFTDCQLEISEQ